jgi:hypothetical protein
LRKFGSRQRVRVQLFEDGFSQKKKIFKDGGNMSYILVNDFNFKKLYLQKRAHGKDLVRQNKVDMVIFQ